MHELSVVMGIIAIAEEQIGNVEHCVIEEIELDIGTLSGIELASFDFAWQQAVKRTVLQNTIKRINRIDGKAKCLDCDTEFAVEQFYDPCPACGKHLLQILQGKEMRVKSLLVR